jgi:hemoglobin
MDISTRQHIEVLVTTFYNKLATDQLLQDIFIARLGPSNWEPHLQVIVNFWETVLLEATSYKGQSFAPHSTMELHQHHFDRWLHLFNTTVDELYSGPIANTAKQKAQMMATLFMSKINFMRGESLK